MARLSVGRFSTLLLYVAIGAIGGGLLGIFLQNMGVLSGALRFLVSGTPIFAIAPFTLDLFVFQITFGFAFVPNLMAILGIGFSLYVYRKY